MMNTKKNYLYNAVCELITTLIPLITMPYVTRILGTDGLGQYTYVQTIASYFVLFANFGVKAYGNRCIAQVRDNPDARNRMFSGIFYQQLALSLTVTLLYIGYAAAFGAEYRVIFAVFGINLVSAMLEISWLFYGMETFRPVALCTIVIKITVAAGIFLFVREKDDLWVYAVLCSAGVLAVQLFLWMRAIRLVRFVHVPFAEIRKHFLPCFALLIPMLAPTLNRSIDKLMLESAIGQDSVGLYGAAEQLQTCMLGFITGLGTVMLPRVSHLLAQGKEQEANHCIGLSMQFSVFLGTAFTFGIASVSDLFVPYYFGRDFKEAAILTAVLSPTILLISWAEVIRSQYIIPHKRDRIFIISVVCGAVINLICNHFMIPFFARHLAGPALSETAAGTLGALPGTLLAELTVIFVQVLFLRRELPYGDYVRSCLIFPIAGILMTIAVRLAGAGLHAAGVTAVLPVLAAEVATGGLLYCLIVGGYYYFFRRDTLLQLIRRS